MLHIQKTTNEEKIILRNLMQHYLHEMSELSPDIQMNANGEYPQKYFESYFSEDKSRGGFLASQNNQLVGFCLVNEYTIFSQHTPTKSIAEFYILPRYRKQGLGKAFAHEIFARYPGRRETRQFHNNTRGEAFRKATIQSYPAKQFRQKEINSDSWHGPIQVFHI